MGTVVRLRRLLLEVTARLRFLPPLLARVAVGAVFVQTGWGKLHNLDQIVGFFRELGIPAPELQAPFVATVEFVGGIMILLGLGARLAAALLTCTMVVATVTAVWPQVDGILELLGKIEVLYFVLFVWIAVAGPGAISLDAILARRLDRDRGKYPQHAGRPALA